MSSIRGGEVASRTGKSPAETFQQARDILAARGRGPCQHKPHDRPRSYAFTGSLYCGVCQRRMQGHWINAAPYYRCRFPAEYALASKISHPRNVYLRQDAFGAQVNTWLATAFASARLSSTVDQIMAGQQAHTDRPAAQAAMARIEEASVKMARYRAALDAGGDPEEIGKWIAQAKTQRLAAEAELRQATAGATPNPVRWPAPTRSSACDSLTTPGGPRASHSRPKTREYRQMVSVRGRTAPIGQCTLAGEFALRNVR